MEGPIPTQIRFMLHDFSSSSQPKVITSKRETNAVLTRWTSKGEMYSKHLKNTKETDHIRII